MREKTREARPRRSKDSMYQTPHLPHRNKIFCIALTLSMSVSAFASSAYAEKNDLTRIFYYRDGAVARQSLFAHYKHIDILAPQIYAIHKDAELENELANDEALAFARAQKLKV